MRWYGSDGGIGLISDFYVGSIDIFIRLTIVYLIFV